MTSSNAVQHLFDHFKADLRKYRPDLEGKFVCPLCSQGFTSTGKLSKAHLWPQKLGGAIYTLTCRKCNNRVGSEIEKHEVGRVKYFQQERTPVRAELADTDGSIGGHISVYSSKDDVPGIVFEIEDGHSNPETLSEYRRQFGSGSPNEVTFIFKGRFNEDIARLTYLHFAYMSLFHLAGYSWYRLPQAQKIRAQLNEPTETFFPVLIGIVAQSQESVAQPSQPVLREMRASETPGLVVLTPELSHLKNSRVGVWIPQISGGDTTFPNPQALNGSPLVYTQTVRVDPGGLVFGCKELSS